MAEKKLVLKLVLHDDKDKQKAMKAVAGISGIDSVAMDMKNQKMTVIGVVDPVEVVAKLRKTWQTGIVSIGPAKEAKKDDAGKKDDADKKKDPNKQIAELLEIYKDYNPHYTTHYFVRSSEEDPNACAVM